MYKRNTALVNRGAESCEVAYYPAADGYQHVIARHSGASHVAQYRFDCAEILVGLSCWKGRSWPVAVDRVVLDDVLVGHDETPAVARPHEAAEEASARKNGVPAGRR